MTRWKREFEQHPFKQVWADLMVEAGKLEVDDTTVVEAVEEAARLKKALAFIDKIISHVDLELIPRSVWSNCESQAQVCFSQIRSFSTSRGVNHLVAANENADNLLSYVRPYMVAPEQALEAIGVAVKAFSDQVVSYTRSFQERGSHAQAVLAAAEGDARARLNNIEAMEQKAQKFDAYLFEGIDGNVSMETFVERLSEKIQSRLQEIDALHLKLIHGPDSTSAQIAAADKQIRNIHDQLDSMLKGVKAECSELGGFHDRIFGTKASMDDDRREGGLKAELDDRIAQLTKFEAEHRTRHQAMFDKIDSLLPGAASAGLATAYKSMRDSFQKPISRYTQAFYAALGLLFLGGLFIVSDSISIIPLEIKLVQARDWQDVLRTMLTRLPIIVPVVWVAIFSATRRSQYERLQQEYAHKEALASSYESYKKQLQDLQVDAEQLQQVLIAKAVDAIAYNASVTLDGKHMEKPPALQLLEKLSLDDVKKIMDIVRSKATADGVK
ncbi:hypothetical protein AVMA1855_05995 [Acidovorax sp. SUPP1855]|uniref:hypothetical protein n=1 Tax=Acidovorax sp. SUPP1855 TaxID=431774 RepID=UPI0023DE3E6C|nr:hypothetical protein [Acidovorax sp. SUPP1855]GKS83673.1 hypothetical protein AVMA1855_05995 [Acidovorax sp. SUPP1855]